MRNQRITFWEIRNVRMALNYWSSKKAERQNDQVAKEMYKIARKRFCKVIFDATNSSH